MMYVCPHHPEVRQDHPGTCPKCGGMKLLPETELQKKDKTEGKSWLQVYRPLLIIVALIALPAAALTVRDALAGNTHWWLTMRYFMAGFFLVFSGFKLFDVPGFAKGYATYDLLAMRVQAYGYVYPFIELALGLAYLTGYQLDIVNMVTFVLMVFSGVGVAVKVAKREKFKCACLGTFIDVPLTTVTLVEDFGMALMAGVMVFF